MRRLWLGELDAAGLAAVIGRSTRAAASALEVVRPILEAVRERGDRAVAEYSLKLDRVEPRPILLHEADIAARARLVDNPRLIEALRSAAANIELVHRAQIRVEPAVEPVPGVQVWRESRPIAAVGLYVPGGSAALPSTALMLAIPAAVAGCERRILCTPPTPDGGPAPVVCAAAQIAGVREVYCAGGAQAIAALAFGTESLEAVDKVFGPGNRYVAAAKQLVSVEPGGVAIDLLAGPSEVLVVADGTASPAWVAADLLAQAEHDPDAVVTLIADSEALVDAVERCVEAQIQSLPRAAIARRAMGQAVAVLVKDREEAGSLADRLAPEHLALHVEHPEGMALRVRTAGAVFVGGLLPEAAGDYATGANHTLPTGRAARHSSGLSLDAFQRWITFQSADRSGLAALAPVVTALARAEGLEAHARSVEQRLS